MLDILFISANYSTGLFAMSIKNHAVSTTATEISFDCLLTVDILFVFHKHFQKNCQKKRMNFIISERGRKTSIRKLVSAKKYEDLEIFFLVLDCSLGILDLLLVLAEIGYGWRGEI